MTDVALLDLFADKVDFTDSCWLWTGAKNPNGYGVFRGVDRTHIAHRWAYETFVEPCPGLDVDHLCRVRNCVNPDHLEAVTRQENLLRGVGLAAQNAAKTHCPQGHLLSGDNLCGGTPGRKCKICKNKVERERRRRLRA